VSVPAARARARSPRASARRITLETAFGGMFADLVETTPARSSPSTRPRAARRRRRDPADQPQHRHAAADHLPGRRQRPPRATTDPHLPAAAPQAQPGGCPPRCCWTLVVRHLAGWGNAFLGKEFDGHGRLVALWPIRPSRSPSRRSSATAARSSASPGTKGDGVAAEDLHARRRHPHHRRQPRRLARLSARSPSTARRSAPRSRCSSTAPRRSRNRAVPTGVLKIKKALKDPSARKRLRAEWKSLYGARRKAHEIAILDEDAEFSRSRCRSPTRSSSSRSRRRSRGRADLQPARQQAAGHHRRLADLQDAGVQPARVPRRRRCARYDGLHRGGPGRRPRAVPAGAAAATASSSRRAAARRRS
jgi:hypothetical protein